jgi:hypothetical protein
MCSERCAPGSAMPLRAGAASENRSDGVVIDEGAMAVRGDHQM